MKKGILFAALLLGAMHSFAQEQLEIKSGSSLELTYEDFKTNIVEIKNKSMKSFAVKVEDASTKKWIKGFGMGPKAKEQVDVNPGHLLVLTNDSDKDIHVALNFIERPIPKKVIEGTSMVTFTLHNSSAKSIPLVIPSVMNPNLSPFSDSGVKLKMGQMIYYKKNGRKKILLVVDDTIKNGDKIDVAERIGQLEKEN